ncbi:MAG: hypothetical protein LBG60_16805 [Bifidobacteriaceae bacterium]|jgi:hypothetical protein|nr:hypothetical protein [Bifidobacteriaceae bacterium]
MGAGDLSAMLDHPVFKPLAALPRWTFSDPSKRPIDMVALRDGHRVAGARFRDARCLVPAREVLEILSALGVAGLGNLTFFLDAQLDRLAVVDIDPGCGPRARRALERLPALYREVSMSGRGAHLVMPLPPEVELDTFNQVKLRAPDDHWEILLHQFCAFTGRQAEAGFGGGADADWQRIWSGLESSLRPAPSAGRGGAAREYGATTLPDLDLANLAVLLRADAQLRHIAGRDVSNWGGDHSKREFAFICAALELLDRHVERRRQFAPDSDISADDRLGLVVQAFAHHIPHRPKHDEIRPDGAFVERRVRWAMERRRP